MLSLHHAHTQPMPTRNLLDILTNIEQWVHFTHHNAIYGVLSTD